VHFALLLLLFHSLIIPLLLQIVVGVVVVTLLLLCGCFVVALLVELFDCTLFRTAVQVACCCSVVVLIAVRSTPARYVAPQLLLELR